MIHGLIYHKILLQGHWEIWVSEAQQRCCKQTCVKMKKLFALIKAENGSFVCLQLNRDKLDLLLQGPEFGST